MASVSDKKLQQQYWKKVVCGVIPPCTVEISNDPPPAGEEVIWQEMLAYYADVKSATLYSSYGAMSKSFNVDSMPFGHNGQRRSLEISTTAQTAEFWEYDGDVGRRWNLDPIIKDWESPYMTFSGNPVWFIDPLGLDKEDPNGKTLPTVTVKATRKMSKKRRDAINKLAKNEHLSFWEAALDIDAKGNRIVSNSIRTMDHTKDDNLIEKDIRKISTQMKINILKGATIVEGSAIILLTGAELWSPFVTLATDKSIEFYVVTNMALNSARRKILTYIIDLAILKYGKDALYRKELWDLAAEAMKYKDLTQKAIITIVKQLDNFLKK